MLTIDKCNICGNLGEELYNLGDYNVLWCKECDLKWVDKVCTDEEYIQTDYYWAWDYFIKNEKYFRKIWRKELQYILKILDKLNIKDKKWIDFGCGFAYLVSEAKKKGFDVIGVEAKKEVVDFIRKREEINVINSLIDKVELPYDSYSIVTFFDVLEHLINPKSAIIKAKKVLQKEGLLVLEHLINPKSAIIKAKKVLQKEGLLVIEVPDDNSLFRKIAYFLYKISSGKYKSLLINAFQKHPGGHKYGFSKKTLIKLLEQSGFQIIKIKKVMIPYKIFILDTIRKKNFIMKIFYFFVSSFLYVLSIVFFLQNRVKIYAKNV